MWDFLGRNNELLHVDLVLIDEKGNTMYAEIAAGHAKKYKGLIKEGGVYLIKDFFVQQAKNRFKAVPGQFMIKISPWTKADPAPNVPDNYPLYAYFLTSFDKLPSLVGGKEMFIDVLGIVTGISELLNVRLPGQAVDSHKRTLHLVNIDGLEIDCALWGEKATSFPAEDLYEIAQSEVLIALMVGTLMKSYKGHDTISCGEAGKYYINPDIPEKREYCERLGQQLPAVRWLTSEDDHYYNPLPLPDAEQVELKDLLSADPNDYLGLRMICTVTVTQLKSNNWWFMACSKCHKTSYAMDNKFVCSGNNCPSIQAEPRYKIRVLGSDGTGEVELIFFAMVAEQLIGKKADILARAAARKSNAVPAEVSALVSQKYTLNISVSERGLSYGELAFQVNSVDAVHRKAKVFEFAALASSSKQSTDRSIPSVPFKPLMLTNKDPVETSSEAAEDNDGKEPVETSSKVDEDSDGKDADATSATPDNAAQQDYLTENSQRSNLATPPPVTPGGSSVKHRQSKKRPGSDVQKPTAGKQLFKKTE